MKTVYLALGSNLGDREAHLRAAIDALQFRGPAVASLEITRISPVYETEPVGYRDQGWFLNLVIEVKTSLLPLQLLQRIQRIERELGRKRTVQDGPRTVDIDILLYGRAAIHSVQLEIPHPRYRERRFVLAPLADLAAHLRDPVTHQTVKEMLAAISGQAIKRVGELAVTIPTQGS